MSQDTRPADAAIYVFGSFTLEPRFRRLLQHDTIVPLTTKAFDTLEVLVRSAGSTVTKDELLKQVWPGTFVQEDTLTQNISTIRRALGDSPDTPSFVLTVPREGYRFISPVEIVQTQPIVEGWRQADQPTASSLRPVRAHQAQRWLVHYLVGAASGLMLAAIWTVLWNRSWDQPRVAPVPTRFEVHEPEGTRFSTSGGALALSPDGRQLAFLATDADGNDHLWIRPVGLAPEHAGAGNTPSLSTFLVTGQ